MSGFEPKTYTKSEISAATGFAPPEVDQVADFLNIKRTQYRDEHLALFQQFQSMMKENGWTVNQAIAAHRTETPSGKPPVAETPSTATNSAFNETTGHLNRESDQSSLDLTNRLAANIKHNAQTRAGDIETSTNLLTAYYLTTGEYDDPEVKEQVKRSELLLDAQVGSTPSLGKLLAATGIPGLQTIPAIASAQKSLKLLSDRQH